MHNSVQTQEDMFPATMSLQQFKAQCNKSAIEHRRQMREELITIKATTKTLGTLTLKCVFAAGRLSGYECALLSPLSIPLK